MACAFLHDVITTFNEGNSPIFTCSLDAEKCFDTIWHTGLFYKLINVLPEPQWMFLYRWYNNLKATVKWNGQISPVFSVTRGTRQGSSLSPSLFNIFINDLLKELSSLQSGVKIGNDLYNSMAYADDITLLSSTVPGLQKLIDVCYNYSKTWRFCFGLKKITMYGCWSL